jgi:dTDP-4-dehydrorhamnose reductase
LKVLVTGSTGQLAQSLLERAAGWPDIEMIALGRPDLDLEISGSAADAVRRIAPDVVLNAAAYTAVDQAEDEPERAFRINGEAAGELAAAARAGGVRIIQISTDYVFDGTGAGAYRDDAPTNPIGVYGRSKLEGEEQVRRHNPDHTIVRTAWVYSPFGRNFLKTMMALAETRDTLTVVGDQHGNPSSALDLADGLLALLGRWTEGERTGLGETFHLAGTGSATWAEFAAAIMAELKRRGRPSAEVRPIRTEDWPTKAVRPRNSELDSSNFAHATGFSMPPWRISAEQVVARLLAAA